MGEFTQNLLKLTEFPFSYSLMGLLALIFGQVINLEELSFAKIGPLLILMGFVATTLSICDPVGTLQRLIIKSERPIKRPQAIDLGLDPKSLAYKFLNVTKFGRAIMSHFTIPYIFAVLYSPEDVKMDQRIDFKSMLKWYDRTAESIYISSYNLHDYKYFARDLNFVSSEKIVDIFLLLEGFKQQTITKAFDTFES